MVIAIIADDKKKELMAQFCIAYCGILSKHRICATGITGKYVSEATGLKIEKLLSGTYGGAEQITSRIAYNEIDLVLLFTDPNTTDPWDDSQMIETIRHCDKHNVPIATNLASAEMLIMGLQRGDLDWREMLRSKKF
jgi:methylglyoxal synthase